MITEAVQQRFWSRVERTDSCWEWLGAKTTAGYGHLRIGSGRYEYSHRLAYMLTVGPIPEGLVLDHLCRNRACCNPGHLEPVSQRENVQRGMAPYGLRSECKHGHDITEPSNVYVDPKGQRRCRACAKERQVSLRIPNWPPSRCPKGHEYTPENTQRTPDGHRRCAECNRQRARAAWLRKKAAS